jgi:hypothetical protein
MNKIIAVGILTLLSLGIASAQDSQVHWKRSESPTRLDLQLFHSTQVVNLMTAETLQRGDILFEISHRFFPAVHEGMDAFYGLDGPVNMRLGLGYAISNRMIVTLARSNVNDNVDLWVKYKALQIRSSMLPISIAVQGGSAWNTQEYFGRKRSDSKNFQYYGQLIANTMIAKKLGIGIAPSYLQNSQIFSIDTEHSVTLGTYVQYYISFGYAVFAEWNPTLSGYRLKHNSFTCGFELETGGHFFKIIATNSPYLNPSQFAAGADVPFDQKNWRLGFNITRLLRFSRPE